MRRVYLVLILVVVVVFLAVSALLARVWSADGAESSAVTALVKAEARGDRQAMLDRLTGCRANAACRSRVAILSEALQQSGSITILQDQSSTGFSLSGTTGSARVAWKSSSSLPIVQCIRVRRSGDALSGLKIELLAISARIKSDADCPARF